MRRGQKVRILAGVLVSSVLVLAGAQANWEGTAVVGRYGEFPPGGLYAASNTFPLNSLIDVTNPDTGESARLIVARELDDNGVFLVLSEDAADALGMEPDESITMRAAPVQLPGLTSVDPNRDLPFHPDPDVNPAASLGDPNRAIVMPDTLEPEESEAVATDNAPATTITEAPAPVETPAVEPPTTEPADAADADVAAAAPDAAVANTPAEEGPREEAPPEVTPPDETSDAAVAAPEIEIAPIISAPTAEEQAAAEDVIGVAPEMSANDVVADGDESADRLELSFPVFTPDSIAPLTVELDLPSLPAESDDEEAVASADDSVSPDASDETAAVDDPLAERLDTIAADLASRTVSPEPLELSPPETFETAQPASTPDDFGVLPEVDLSAAVEAEVTEAIPAAPNPVRVAVELPPASERDVVQVSETPPQPPELGDNEVALPIAPLDVEASDESLRITAGGEAPMDVALAEPDLPGDEPAAVADEMVTEDTGEPDASDELRPTLIPEDAIISLEPAEFRSPEPPEPRADDIAASEPTAGDAAEDEDLAMAEPAPPAEEPEEEAEIAAAPAGAIDGASPEDAPAPAATAEPRPEPDPEPTPAPEPAPEPDPEPSAPPQPELPLVTDLDRGAAYVQVAALSSAQSVRRAIESLGTGLPVAVLSQEADGRSLYRVYVGPLSDAEKGSALFHIRNRGFRDAFVR